MAGVTCGGPPVQRLPPMSLNSGEPNGAMGPLELVGRVTFACLTGLTVKRLFL